MFFSLNRLDSLNFVAFSEASLSQEAASAIPDDLSWLVMVLWIYRLNLLFNCLHRSTENRKGVRLYLRANSPKYSVNDLPLGNCSYLCDSACLAITSPEQASPPSLVSYSHVLAWPASHPP